MIVYIKLESLENDKLVNRNNKLIIVINYSLIASWLTWTTVILDDEDRSGGLFSMKKRKKYIYRYP